MSLQTFSTPMLLVGQLLYCYIVIHHKCIIKGHGLTVEHIRYNSDCDVYEELEPIERNLKYDFNFQQINHLKSEVIIKPVSGFILKYLSHTTRYTDCIGRPSATQMLLWH